MATTARKSGGSVMTMKPLLRQSVCRSGPFVSSSMTSSDAFAAPSSFAYSTSYYSSQFSSEDFLARRRVTSPPRVNLHGLSSPPPRRSIRFQVDRSMSPRRSIAAPLSRDQVVQKRNGDIQKKTCLCSPTTHPGSFRCALHKNSSNKKLVGSHGSHSTAYSPSRLNMRRSAMKNSLVRIGTVEGDLVKRALSALIRPSSHQQRRRASYQPRPSRLSVMSRAEDYCLLR